MNLLNLQTMVSEAIGDPHQQRYVPEQLNSYINYAYREVCLAAETSKPDLFTKTDRQLLSAGFNSGVATRDYDRLWSVSAVEVFLPSDFIRLVGAHIVTYALEVEAHVAEVEIVPFTRAQYYSDLDSSVDYHGYVRHTAGSTMDLWILGVVEATTAQYCRIFYVARPTAISASTSPEKTLELPDEYERYVVAGSAMKILVSENRDASQYRDEYEKGLALMTGSLGEKHGTRPRRSRE